MSSFPSLLRPGRIGPMALRNRLVMSPMETMYGTPDGLPSERTRDYFAARAEGGVGLITVGATGIDHLHPETPGGLHLGTDDGVAFTPYGGTRRELAADSVIIAGHPEADTALFDALTDRLPGAKVHAVGDCTGLGLIRKATEDGARAACSI